MKKAYYTPVLNMLVLEHDILTTSDPTGINNVYKPGNGLAPERRNIWE